jgi:hypothetical protein
MPKLWRSAFAKATADGFCGVFLFHGVLDEWWLSLKRKGVSTRFSLSALNFPRFQESSIVFTPIRESLSISFLLLF